MRFSEFLVEAREDQIATQQNQQFVNAFNNKESTTIDPISVLNYVNYFSKVLGPHLKQYIQWIINMYIKDAHFKIENIQDLYHVIAKYDELKKDVKANVNKNILTYKNIDDLRTDVVAQTNTPTHLKQITHIIYDAMQQQVHLGNARWYYQSPAINVYLPFNWTAAKAIRLAVGENNTSLSVTNTKTPEYFNDYAEQGRLFFVLTPNMMYAFFFSDMETSKTPPPKYNKNMSPLIYQQALKDWQATQQDNNDEYPNIDIIPSEFADLNNNKELGKRFFYNNKEKLSHIFARLIPELSDEDKDLFD